jgi:amino acid transporter
VSTSTRVPTSSLIKRALVGRAVTSDRLEHTLLPKTLALPVFSSDALSSVAYATEEILHVLLLYTVAAYAYVMPIAIAIAALLAIVVLSYRQTVKAYPNGGGAYIVSKENLGVLPGLVAAAALLTDYVLTVSVSVVAGVFAMTSAAPALLPYKIELSVGFVMLITLANLRGVKEAGALFALPTYAFIMGMLATIVVGLARCVGGCPAVQPVPPGPDLTAAVGVVGLFAILRAFSSGATALTGVEAISNGVPAFRRPQAKNAAETLATMGVLAITMFVGISFLASRMHPTVSEQRSVVAQIALAVFGHGILFYLVQVFTTAILVLAANTSYQDFPRLSSILARDRFMPRQFANRGDRLVFSNGVLVLALFASVLIVIFRADLNRLIQLYVIGVFTSFTLSQTGMVKHWRAEGRKGEPAEGGWRRSMVINGIGAAATFLVLCVVTYTKFSHGAYIVIVAIPLIVMLFRSINEHYRKIGEQLRTGGGPVSQVPSSIRVVLLVRDLDTATAEALGFVRALRPRSVSAVYDGPVSQELQERWRGFGGTPDLDPLPLGGTLLERMTTYLGSLPKDQDPSVNVVVPELVSEGLLGYLLLRRELIRLKGGLLKVPGVVVTDVPVAAWAAEAKPLIPRRLVALVFVSGMHDATRRAINFARSLGAVETRAIYFDLDPDEAQHMEEAWFDESPGVPLDIVEAPFRDLTGPMQDEIRRFTKREDTLVAVVIPEFLVPRKRHLLLHNQNALFVKRLLLFEERTTLSSVPYRLEVA